MSLWLRWAKNICCGYSLESTRRGDSNEYSQHMFLKRNKQNYPLIFTKYPLSGQMQQNKTVCFCFICTIMKEKTIMQTPCINLQGQCMSDKYNVNTEVLLHIIRYYMYLKVNPKTQVSRSHKNSSRTLSLGRSIFNGVFLIFNKYYTHRHSLTEIQLKCACAENKQNVYALRQA